MRGIVAVCALLLSLGAAAEDGLSASSIKIGMANALSGPAAGLGLQLRAGAQAYLDKVNAAGGVHGRRIELISVDDAYDPRQAAQATQQLIQQDKVFALFGYVGTPTSAVAVPLAQQAGVPYLFPFTGADMFRTPVIPMVYHLRASYADEMEALVGQLAKGGARRFALFIQDDAFGASGKGAALNALAKRKLRPVLETRYRRNTVDVDAGLAELVHSQADAVLFVGTYRPLANLLKKARTAGLQAPFATLSFVGTSELIKHAGGAAEGLLISQVMPAPDEAGEAFQRQYHADVPAPARNYGSIEGYADAVVLVEALRRCGRELSRSCLLQTLDSLQADLGGLAVQFDARHQGLSRIYLTQVQHGQARAVRLR
ncbi:ABC transporter substrate-binding protein [Massilia sp. TS11]|uniref:ABC transporter substrate-binding protein n=1 Tax=Massilia sp. TS11 TaxID=2908003 RepID=UPI001EDBEF61|nr:ABC transporter substrate-binding protein [Massilia sp. TS11]MCG2585744.1 ABC transporter substrate-binding protein [Massilia sp. TS11]